jgi:hypothetical protein
MTVVVIRGHQFAAPSAQGTNAGTIVAGAGLLRMYAPSSPQRNNILLQKNFPFPRKLPALGRDGLTSLLPYNRHLRYSIADRLAKTW